jgi:hypothetical protein
VRSTTCTVDPVSPVDSAVPSCGTPVRGRVGFVVAELGSVWRELREHLGGRRAARTSSGGMR